MDILLPGMRIARKTVNRQLMTNQEPEKAFCVLPQKGKELSGRLTTTESRNFRETEWSVKSPLCEDKNLVEKA